MSPDLGAIQEFRAKEAEFNDKHAEMKAVTEERDAVGAGPAPCCGGGSALLWRVGCWPEICVCGGGGACPSWPAAPPAASCRRCDGSTTSCASSGWTSSWRAST
jgi:hypothetical protein